MGDGRMDFEENFNSTLAIDSRMSNRSSGCEIAIEGHCGIWR
jgi:hypothetical protein